MVLVGVLIAGMTAFCDVRTTWSFSAFTVLVYYGITNYTALCLPRESRRYPRVTSVCGLIGCLGLAFWVDTTVFVLNMPLVTGLLFVVGLVALFIEFSAPGISIGGLLAILCFSLFFWGKFLGGTAGWLEVVLFLLGIIFLMLEVFLVPGFGVPGISGILLIVASLVMASQDFFMPTRPSEWKTTGNSLLVVLG